MGETRLGRPRVRGGEGRTHHLVRHAGSMSLRYVAHVQCQWYSAKCERDKTTTLLYITVGSPSSASLPPYGRMPYPCFARAEVWKSPTPQYPPASAVRVSAPAYPQI